MSEKKLGLEKYTPTRLEWLSVLLNGIIQMFDSPGLESFFTPGDDSETIVLAVVHRDIVPKEVVDSYIDRLKNLAQLFSKNHGWDSWIKVETEINIIESKKNEEEKNL